MFSHQERNALRNDTSLLITPYEQQLAINIFFGINFHTRTVGVNSRCCLLIYRAQRLIFSLI